MILDRALEPVLTRWNLSAARLVAETPRSLLFRVMRGDEQLALKLLKPAAAGDEERGGALLAWYAGHGAAKVFELASDAVLLQWLEGETLGDVARGGRDGEATRILCEVAGMLHAPRHKPPPELLTLHERFASLFETRPAHWPEGTRPLLSHAVDVAQQLLADPMPATPLHGDLHHDNILRTGDKWLAIDPKGLLGDPAYEFANSFQNPERAEALVLSEARIARHATAISEQTGTTRKRLLAWALAHVALSGAWHIEDGNTPSHQVGMLQLLIPILEAEPRSGAA